MAVLPDNVSMNGESLWLAPGLTYWLIDALYLTEIVEESDRLNRQDLVASARRLFEWNPTPFARFELLPVGGPYELEIADIVLGDEAGSAYAGHPEQHFGTDSAVMVVVAEQNLLTLIERKFSYNDLIECAADEQPYHEVFSARYWQQVTAGIVPVTVGLIYSPGLGAGFDFVGSGFYRLRV
ncbi:hypothetical protein LJ737_18490 [Hymenobacter sp. 15J16-1T3B]|uniref:hypothetical protein n=1 Tax=Hymenobacter sp. 15J16-1T3B TaxID=2886941 RepID=UPI001D113612|nr:hypothetical protein [Hymenobacter sp. 15J16-1T3B]MCC3159237.1 hypothetical protein [Hymenobacter sp. 15J16-1T3B]